MNALFFVNPGPMRRSRRLCTVPSSTIVTTIVIVIFVITVLFFCAILPWVIVFGEASPQERGFMGVGKTSLVDLIVKGTTTKHPSQTIGCTVDVKHFTYGAPSSSSDSVKGDKDRDFFIALWDVSGHDRCTDCRSIFYSQINDVVGELFSIKPLRIIKENGKEKRSMAFELQDVAGKQVKCNIWGEHANKLQDFMSKKNQTCEHIIIMIQNTQIKEWPKGSKQPQISNQLNGARLHINTQAPPIVASKTELLSRDGVDISPTQLPERTQDTIVDDPLDYYLKSPYKSVDHLRSITKVKYTCVLKATVSRILLEEGWCTFLCQSCNKKAVCRITEAPTEGLYDSIRCGPVKNVVGKVRTVVRVHDATGSTSLILFDSQLSKLISRSTSWLNRKVESISNPQSFPHELQGLINKEIVCKVQVGLINIQDGYPAYTVHRATHDGVIIAAYEAKEYDLEEEAEFEETLESTPYSKGYRYRLLSRRCLYISMYS